MPNILFRALRADFFVALLCVALPAAAQDMEQPAAKCTAVVAPPPALAGWTNKIALTSADAAAGLPKAMLAPGKGATVDLHPTRTVHYVTQPDKPGGSVAHGGLLGINIADPGTYQVSINSGAWIDVLQDGKTLISTAHAPGPACTGMKKTVQFSLQPGSYVVQISADADPSIEIMVSKVS